MQVILKRPVEEVDATIHLNNTERLTLIRILCEWGRNEVNTRRAIRTPWYDPILSKEQLFCKMLLDKIDAAEET